MASALESSQKNMRSHDLGACSDRLALELDMCGSFSLKDPRSRAID